MLRKSQITKSKESKIPENDVMANEGAFLEFVFQAHLAQEFFPFANAAPKRAWDHGGFTIV